jgi:ureidoglycolate hydrolase
MRIITLELIQELFELFGRILEPLSKETPKVKKEGFFNFFVIFKEFAKGWQIGYLEQMGKVVKVLECHPNTPEVFIPLSGEAILLVAVDPKKEISAFKLDKPIVLNRGIWHGVISLSESSEILIVENPDVTSEFHELEKPISDKSLN